MTYLKERGVSTGIHYPTALPLLPAYGYLHYGPEDIPVASAYQDRILSLPMYPEITPEQIEYVSRGIASFLNTGK